MQANFTCNPLQKVLNDTWRPVPKIRWSSGTLSETFQLIRAYKMVAHFMHPRVSEWMCLCTWFVFVCTFACCGTSKEILWLMKFLFWCTCACLFAHTCERASRFDRAYGSTLREVFSQVNFQKYYGKVRYISASKYFKFIFHILHFHLLYPNLYLWRPFQMLIWWWHGGSLVLADSMWLRFKGDSMCLRNESGIDARLSVMFIL